MTGLQRIHNEEDEKKEPTIDGIDPEHIKMICNPAYYAFKDALKVFHETPSNEIIEEMHTILLMDGSQGNSQILRMLPELFPYFSQPEFYEKLCLLFSDVSHLNKPISDSLLKFEIFSKLDYEKDITFSLVLSICDCNEGAWQIFKTGYLTESIQSHPKIRMLVSQEE